MKPKKIEQPVEQPSEKLFAFPITRRAGYIRRVADRMIAKDTSTGSELVMTNEMLKIRRLMKERGFDEAAVLRQLASFEGAVKALIWSEIFPELGA